MEIEKEISKLDSFLNQNEVFENLKDKVNEAKKRKLKEEVELEGNTRRLAELERKAVKDEQTCLMLQEDNRKFEQKIVGIKTNELSDNREQIQEARQVRVDAEQQLS